MMFGRLPTNDLATMWAGFKNRDTISTDKQRKKYWFLIRTPHLFLVRLKQGFKQNDAVAQEWTLNGRKKPLGDSLFKAPLVLYTTISTITLPRLPSHVLIEPTQKGDIQQNGYKKNEKEKRSTHPDCHAGNHLSS
jgi:hypothetical protein